MRAPKGCAVTWLSIMALASRTSPAAAQRVGLPFQETWFIALLVLFGLIICSLCVALCVYRTRYVLLSRSLDDDRPPAEAVVIISDAGEDLDDEMALIMARFLIDEQLIEIKAVIANLQPAYERARLVRGTLDILRLQAVPVGSGTDGGAPHTKNQFAATATYLPPVDSERAQDIEPGRALLHRTLLDAAPKSITLCCISSFKDAALFMRDNGPLCADRLKRVVVMGGCTAESVAACVSAATEPSRGSTPRGRLSVASAAAVMSAAASEAGNVRRRASDMPPTMADSRDSASSAAMIGAGKRSASVLPALPPASADAEVARLVPDTAHNNAFDAKAASYLYEACQVSGVPLTVVARYAAYAAPVRREIYDHLAQSGSPIGWRLRKVQRDSIERLWRRACAPDGDAAREGLPARCDREWFSNTFCKGHAKNRGRDDPIWDLVASFNMYDVLALIACSPPLAAAFFTPVAFTGARGARHEVIGVSADAPGVREGKDLSLFVFQGIARAIGVNARPAERQTVVLAIHDSPTIASAPTLLLLRALVEFNVIACAAILIFERSAEAAGSGSGGAGSPPAGPFGAAVPLMQPARRQGSHNALGAGGTIGSMIPRVSARELISQLGLDNTTRVLRFDEGSNGQNGDLERLAETYATLPQGTRLVCATCPLLLAQLARQRPLLFREHTEALVAIGDIAAHAATDDLPQTAPPRRRQAERSATSVSFGVGAAEDSRSGRGSLDAMDAARSSGARTIDDFEHEHESLDDDEEAQFGSPMGPAGRQADAAAAAARERARAPDAPRAEAAAVAESDADASAAQYADGAALDDDGRSTTDTEDDEGGASGGRRGAPQRRGSGAAGAGGTRPDPLSVSMSATMGSTLGVSVDSPPGDGASPSPPAARRDLRIVPLVEACLPHAGEAAITLAAQCEALGVPLRFVAESAMISLPSDLFEQVATAAGVLGEATRDHVRAAVQMLHAHTRMPPPIARGAGWPAALTPEWFSRTYCAGAPAPKGMTDASVWPLAEAIALPGCAVLVASASRTARHFFVPERLCHRKGTVHRQLAPRLGVAAADGRLADGDLELRRFTSMMLAKAATLDASEFSEGTADITKHAKPVLVRGIGELKLTDALPEWMLHHADGDAVRVPSAGGVGARAGAEDEPAAGPPSPLYRRRSPSKRFGRVDSEGRVLTPVNETSPAVSTEGEPSAISSGSSSRGRAPPPPQAGARTLGQMGGSMSSSDIQSRFTFLRQRAAEPGEAMVPVTPSHAAALTAREQERFDEILRGVLTPHSEDGGMHTTASGRATASFVLRAPRKSLRTGRRGSAQPAVNSSEPPSPPGAERSGRRGSAVAQGHVSEPASPPRGEPRESAATTIRGSH